MRRFCVNCGKEVFNGNEYCAHCGTKVLKKSKLRQLYKSGYLPLVIIVSLIVIITVSALIVSLSTKSAEESAVELCNARYSNEYEKYINNVLPEYLETITEEDKTHLKEKIEYSYKILDNQGAKISCSYVKEEPMTESEIAEINNELKNSEVDFTAKEGLKVTLKITAKSSSRENTTGQTINLVKRGSRYYIINFNY